MCSVVVSDSKVPRPEKLPQHIFEVDEDADKDEVGCQSYEIFSPSTRTESFSL